jgi:hypothetical protein
MSFARFNSGGSGYDGFSRFNAPAQDNTDPYSTDKIDNQIENARLRISDAGYSTDDGDGRNWFEKATNLPVGQNWFFDALDLIGRPGQAVKNVLDKATGPGATEGIGEAAWKGFSGHDHVTGAEVFDHLSDGDKANGFARFLLGTGLDIVTDPTTYIPGGVIADGAKAALKPIGSVAKVGFDALESAVPAVKTFRENTLEPLVTRAKDSLGYMFNPDYNITKTLGGGESDVLKNLAQDSDNSRRFMQEETLNNIAKTAKDAGGIDTGEDVGRILEAPLRQFDDVKAYEFPDGLRRTENKSDLLSEIDTNRSTIKDIGNSIGQDQRNYGAAISEFSRGLDKTDADIRRLYFGLERTAGKNLDRQTKQNLLDAGRELARLESQINNFDGNHQSMLRNFKKQIGDAHAGNFDLIKRIKEVAPNGIRGVDPKEMPKGIMYRNAGKPIDEVANELGYQYADDLVQGLKRLKDVPQKLDAGTLEKLAHQEMNRAGGYQYLTDKLDELVNARETIKQSIRDISKSATKTKTAKASEMAFADLSAHPKYQELTQQRSTLKVQLDALKGDAKALKEQKISQIKAKKEEIDALREAMRNPVMMQKELPRPKRELSSEPKVQQAAKKLMESNTAVRQLAEENGINISEIEGYMTHILSEEERKSRLKVTSVDKGSRNTGNPNKSILKNRELSGSVEDINEQIGRKFFEPNAYFATGIGQKRLIDYIHAVSFRRQVLTNHDFAIPFKKGMDVPKDAVVIDSNNYTFLKANGDSLEGLVPEETIGGQYIVTKQAKILLDRYQHLNTDEGTKAFLKAWDSMQSFWKRFTLFSPGYHVRNLLGAAVNNSVAGMNVIDLPRYTTLASGAVMKFVRGQETPLYREFRQQGLGSSGLSAIEFAKAGEEPEKAIQKTIENMSKTGMDKVKSKMLNPFKTSQELGDFMDQVNRFALYKWAREAKGMDARAAAAKVREVQYDYSRLTPFEQNVMVRVIPFYRWMRNNIPFQIRAAVNDPRKFEWFNKARQNAQEAVGLNDENMPDYMKQSFAIPVYGKNGEGKFFSSNLPFTDLSKLSNPLKMLVDGVTPILKTPAELALNYNMFYGKPIQKFEGQQKQFQFGPMDFGIPVKTAYALEQATGQIGRGLSGYLQKPGQQDQDTTFRMPTLGISSLTKDFSAAKAAYLQKLQELKQLQDEILYIEQQTGDKPRTKAEIKKGR